MVWIVWCSAWAATWVYICIGPVFAVDGTTTPAEVISAVTLATLSLVAIVVPVGLDTDTSADPVADTWKHRASVARWLAFFLGFLAVTLLLYLSRFLFAFQAAPVTAPPSIWDEMAAIGTLAAGVGAVVSAIAALISIRVAIHVSKQAANRVEPAATRVEPPATGLGPAVTRAQPAPSKQRKKRRH